MIEEVPWDSAFFGRKIGRLTSIPGAEELGSLMRHAAAEGFAYLSCPVSASRIDDVQLLERHGFYMSDISITWTQRTGEGGPQSSRVRMAMPEDKESVVGISRGIFTDGRFYHDPFFSREEADRLYETWAANLFEGLADVVFIIGGKGFIGCSIRGEKGHIPLVGVAAGSQGRGAGGELVRHALGWFRSQGAAEVTVKTQAGNVQAVRLYGRCGFVMSEVAVTLGRVIVP